MKRITLLPLAALFLSAGAVQSQAPVADTTLSSLETMETGNKALIDSQQKTLDVLNQLDLDSQQLKTFAKRS